MDEALSAGHVAGILAPLRDRGVDCVLVGGAAAWAHGASQRPHDVDVVLRGTWDTYEAAAGALADLNARLPDYSHYLGDDAHAALPAVRLDAAAVAVAPITTWATDLGGLDFFDAIDSPQGPLYYEDLIARAEPRNVAGVRVQVASINDVIASKATTARPKDLAVVTELRRLAAQRSAPTPAPPRRPTLANSLDCPQPGLAGRAGRGHGR